MIRVIMYIYHCLFQKFHANLSKSTQTVPTLLPTVDIYLKCFLDNKTGCGAKHTAQYSGNP